jgi:hypothetical protein
MNEPPNPPDANQPPSDSTPPPPPPPPFTPPPASIPPPPSAPHPPIYTPPPGAPAKKSAMPWILGGCGCLTLIAIIAGVLIFMAYKAKQKVTEFKSDFKSALKEIDQTTQALTDPRSVTAKTPKSGWQTYTNVKENLPSSLQPNFVAFRFDYPKSFSVQPQSDVNFVKIEKEAAAGKGNTAENFAVGYAWFTPPDADSEALYDKLLDDLGKQLAGTFHNYKELKRQVEIVDVVKSRAALFQADFNNAAKTLIWGKTIVVHPPGKKNGVTILILGTSLSRDIKSADDLGVKGDTAEILRSFSFL